MIYKNFFKKLFYWEINCVIRLEFKEMSPFQAKPLTFLEVFLMARDALLNVLSMSFVFTSIESGSVA